MALTYVPVIAQNNDITFKDATVTGTLDVAGASTLASLTVTGDETVTGNETVGGTLQVNGNTTLAGLTVNSPASMNNVLAAAVSATSLDVTNSTGTFEALTVRTTGDTQPRVALHADGSINFGSGSAATDTSWARSGPAALNTTSFVAMGSAQISANLNIFSGAGNALRLGTAGGGLAIKSGANATVGTATLTAGSVTVSTTKVTATSIIFLTVQAIGTVTTPKAMTILNKNVGTSFQIVSSDATDTSVVAWWILETV